MDEFGQRSPIDQDGSGKQEKPPDVVVPPTMREVQKPSSITPTPRFDHRVAPFADTDMLPQRQQSHSQSEKEKEVDGGCCKCIIM